MKLPAVGHLLLLSPSLLKTVSSLTIYWDNSCHQKVDNVEAEMLKMAASSKKRLADTSDSNYESAYTRIFESPRSNQNDFDTVHDLMDIISSMTQATDHKSADVRIYCDEDDFGQGNRWELVPDIDANPRINALPNKQRPPDKQEWEDKTNNIRRTLGTKGCKDAGTLGETFCVHGPPALSQGQNPKRCTITLCDATLNFKYQSLDDLPLVKDLSKVKDIGVFDPMTSMVLLHEMTHTRPHEKDDVEIGGVIHYGWNLLQQLSAANARRNADNYAYFGLLAKLADRKVRLSKKAAEAQLGKLTRDTSMPARMIKRTFRSAVDRFQNHPRNLAGLVLGVK